MFSCHAQPRAALYVSMIDFLVAGGYTMIVVIVVGGVMLATSVRFAFVADPKRLALVRALTWALVFAVISGVAVNLSTVCRAIADNPDWLKAPLPILLTGLAESIAPVVLGGAVASISWILVGVGVRRMPA